MIAPRQGPTAPPPHARQRRIGTWGGGLGTFWQEGARIGMIWGTMPDWGQATPPMRAYSHTLGDEVVARRYYDQMDESMRYMRPDLEKKRK